MKGISLGSVVWYGCTVPLPSPGSDACFTASVLDWLNPVVFLVSSVRCLVKARANARNIGQQDVGPNMLRAFARHVVCCCDLLEVVGWSLTSFKHHPTTSNKLQQHATTHNIVCKRSQHVGPNIVASCWPTMLRAFARAFIILIINPAAATTIIIVIIVVTIIISKTFLKWERTLTCIYSGLTL